MATAPELFAPGVATSPLSPRWRRSIAFLIDAVVLAVATNILCTPFFEPLSHLGVLGRIVGLLITLAYFGLMDSRIGHGRTLGKRLLRIEVAHASGRYISVEESIIRTSIFMFPLLLSGLPLPLSRTPAIIFVLINIVGPGVGSVTAYLLLFNRRTRQGLHDLAAASYVLDATNNAPVVTQPIWKGHYKILGCLLTVASLTAWLISYNITRYGPFPELFQDVRLVEQIPEIEYAGMTRQSTPNAFWGTTPNTLQVTAHWSGPSAEEPGLAREIAAKILENDPKAASYDYLTVVIVRGYDLGITSSSVSQTFRHAPADWQ